MSRDSFSKHDVTVTLTGDEWLAVLWRFIVSEQSLSPEGLKLFTAAQYKITAHVLRGHSLSQEGSE